MQQLDKSLLHFSILLLTVKINWVLAEAMINGYLGIVGANLLLVRTSAITMPSLHYCCNVAFYWTWHIIGVFLHPWAKSEQLWAVEQVLKLKYVYSQAKIVCNVKIPLLIYEPTRWLQIVCEAIAVVAVVQQVMKWCSTKDRNHCISEYLAVTSSDPHCQRRRTETLPASISQSTCLLGT